MPSDDSPQVARGAAGRPASQSLATAAGAAPAASARVPAHLDAPLPTHPEFRHDPHLPEHIEEQAARRLRLVLEPVLHHDHTRDPAGDQEGQRQLPIVLEKTKAAKREPILDSVEFRELALSGKTRLSHDTSRYRFSLPRPDDRLGLPIGQHVSIAATVNGKRVIRSYTPTSLDTETGYFDLVIKTYPNGTLSRHLDSLHIGDKVMVRGPKGKFVYTKTLAPHILMLAGGSGITPMYRIIKAAALDPDDPTQLQLIYANITEGDILLGKELDHLAEKSQGRLKIHYVLEKPPAGWYGGVGYINRQMIQDKIHPGGPSGGGKVLICGPPPMVSAMKKILGRLDYTIPRPPGSMNDEVFFF